MNERIRELANQAHLVADATYARAPDSVWEREYNKRFAELIVRECCDVLKDVYDCHFEAEQLKQHFGVEE